MFKVDGENSIGRIGRNRSNRTYLPRQRHRLSLRQRPEPPPQFLIGSWSDSVALLV